MVAASARCVAAIAAARVFTSARAARLDANRVMSTPWAWCGTIICANITSAALYPAAEADSDAGFGGQTTPSASGSLPGSVPQPAISAPATSNAATTRDSVLT